MIPTMAGNKTTSEIIFEQFLSAHGLEFDPVPIAESPRPDYLVKCASPPFVFEVKELTADDKFAQVPNKLMRRTVGDHIRSKINDSRKQIKFGADRGFPSILLIYNALDPLHIFGTEPHDFRAAMHGEWTLLISRESGKVVDSGFGRNRSFREDNNTNFSALGHMAPRNRETTVTLYVNDHAAVPLPSDLPACFEIAQS